MAGLYIHIPFCRQACRYCDFHFSVNLRRMGDMVGSICKEIALQKDYLGTHTLDTVYFGGGTPSLMEQGHFDKIMSSLKAHFALAHGCEITLEANPDDLSSKQLAMYREAGVNRLSIGIQSFSDAVLTFLNRSHDVEGALRSIKKARAAGFDNLNFDLMYAVPNQDHTTWVNSLETAVSFCPEHVSAYSLIIEPKTVFGHWLSKGKLLPFGEVESTEQFELLAVTLAKAGYIHYEVCNFCKPGFHAVHNSNYWEQKPYLGVGPGAHSFDGHSRQFNIKNNSRYIDAMRQGKLLCEREVLSPAERVNEYIFTSLRTIQGCDFLLLKHVYGIDMAQLYRDYLRDLEGLQLAFIKKNRLLLTAKGRLLADKIASDLFVNTAK